MRLPRSSAATLAVGSVAVALVVLGLKLAAWWLTGSLALGSDALESVVNVAASGAALVAIRLADKPADRQHPYGHHKAEYFSAVLEGVLVIVAALSIAWAAWGALATPRMPQISGLGLGVNAVATILNFAWGRVLIRRGRVMGSPALVADGRHLMTDVLSSAAVLGGLVLARATGWAVLDPLMALAVAVNILWSGWLLVRASVAGLMDEAVEPATMARIHEVILAAAEGAIEAHDIRTRHAGRMTFVDFHLVVPGEMPVSTAHRICDRIEARLHAEIGEAVITIHVEPHGKAKEQGALVI
ncbi:MAG TPA: cation diffusion facilitator family transporter [Paracoccaceae bacterium]|nr:cation diffusion facilitator family transporter [Paracoccaceae bacterium]